MADGRFLPGICTSRLNHRRKLFGHVFSGRYKALLVEARSPGYLKTVCDYMHLHPVRARLLGAEERLLSYPWSSFAWYLAAPAHRPAWIRVDRWLGEHGIAADTAEGRQQFEQRLEARRAQQTDGAHWAPVRRGWCLGSAAFRLRRETTLTIKVIAHRLHLGSWKSASTRLLQRQQKQNDHDKVRWL